MLYYQIFLIRKKIEPLHCFLGCHSSFWSCLVFFFSHSSSFQNFYIISDSRWSSSRRNSIFSSFQYFLIRLINYHKHISSKVGRRQNYFHHPQRPSYGSKKTSKITSTYYLLDTLSGESILSFPSHCALRLPSVKKFTLL